VFASHNRKLLQLLQYNIANKSLDATENTVMMADMMKEKHPSTGLRANGSHLEII